MPDRSLGPGGAASRSARWFAVLLFGLPAGSLLAFAVAARTWWLPVRAAAQAPVVDQVIEALFAISVAFFVAAQFFVALPMLRRRTPGRAFTPAPLTRMPGIAAITAVVVLVVADTTVLALSERDWFRLYSAPPADALRVQVIGRQFFWQFRYPGPDGRFGRTDPRFITSGNPFGMDPSDPENARNVVTANEMHAVVDRPLAIEITAIDVIHSFNLPNFRLKQDAVPGRSVTVWTTPDRTGTYEIACAQLCGVGHYTMRGVLVVQSPRAFAAWLAAQLAAAPQGRAARVAHPAAVSASGAGAGRTPVSILARNAAK